MITAQKVLVEIGEGLAAVCAWCEHWHNAKDRGEEVMCGRLGCGGPMLGKCFPAYKGIMEGHLHTFCFICGGDADACVEIGGGVLGVCNKMGPNKMTCMDRLRLMLENQHSGKRIVVAEKMVPVIGGERVELGSK